MSDYASKHIKRFNPSTDERISDTKQIIYHYTSPHGMYGLLKNATIRLTDCQFLNDKSEFKHIKTPLHKALMDIKNELHPDFENIVKNMINDNFEIDDYQSTIADNSLSIKTTTKKYYVFCSSTLRDSLGMWNYYMKNGNYQGYNLGFNVSTLINCFSSIRNPDIDVFYGKVLYKDSDKIDVLKNLLIEKNVELKNNLKVSKSSEDAISAEQENINDILDYIENYRLFFKDKSFSNEKEYRFVLRLPLGYLPDKHSPISIDFNIKNGVFTPFCELTINRHSTISSICMSPMLEIELAQQGLKRYLKHNDYNGDINIEQSDIPIRY